MLRARSPVRVNSAVHAQTVGFGTRFPRHIFRYETPASAYFLRDVIWSPQPPDGSWRNTSFHLNCLLRRFYQENVERRQERAVELK
jgi:hypothetical protein